MLDFYDVVLSYKLWELRVENKQWRLNNIFVILAEELVGTLSFLAKAEVQEFVHCCT